MGWQDDEVVQGQPTSSSWQNDEVVDDSFLSKTAKNIIPDIKQNIQGMGEMVKGPALDIASGDMASALPKVAKEAKQFWQNPKENLSQMARPITHPVDYFQEKPVSQTLNVLGALGVAKGLMEKPSTPKELPVVEPSKTGEPHGLFSYNSDTNPEKTMKSMYTIYGDPEHPFIKQGEGLPGAGNTTQTLDWFKERGIPIVGREPRTVGKWEPIDLETPAPKNAIGNRLAARTTAQAFDVNPLAIRKLASKAGMTPEDYVLQLGDKANELIPDLIEPMDSANSKFGKIIDAHDEAGSKIGQFYKSVTKGTEGSLPEGQETINALRKAADEYYQVDGGDLALQKTADRLESLQKSGKLDFDRLSKVKSDIGKGFNKTEPPAGTEDIYHILDENAQKAVDRLSVLDPSLAPQLSRLKEIYTTTSRLIPAMSRTAAREVAGANVGGGLLSKAIPSAIGGVLGGPMGALAGAGAKYLQEAIAPDLGKNLAYMAMKSSPEMMATVQKVKGLFPNISEAAAAEMATNILKQKGSQKSPDMDQQISDYLRKQFQ